MRKEFWNDWFGPDYLVYTFGRFRNVKIYNSDELSEWVKHCTINSEPAFVSVQPKNSIFKVFFDFDSKNKWLARLDCLKLNSRLQSFGAKPIIFDTGNRGYHLYAFVSDSPIVYKYDEQIIAFRAYRELIKILVGCDWQKINKVYPTLDKKPLHLAALCRVPYSIHEKTNKQVLPYDEHGKLIEEIDIQDLLEHHIRNNTMKLAVQAAIKQSKNKVEGCENLGHFRIRPCIEKAFRKSPDHEVRLA